MILGMSCLVSSVESKESEVSGVEGTRNSRTVSFELIASDLSVELVEDDNSGDEENLHSREW